MKEYLDHRPLEIEKVGKDLYIRRTNIIEIQHEADPESGEAAYTSWEADAETMTAAELTLLKQTEMEERQALAEDAILELAEIVGGEE